MICDRACDLLQKNTKFVKFRCGIMKTLFGHMMTGVFLWLCCMIVVEYKLGCWMVECIWLECVPCSV